MENNNFSNENEDITYDENFDANNFVNISVQDYAKPIIVPKYFITQSVVLKNMYKDWKSCRDQCIYLPEVSKQTLEKIVEYYVIQKEKNGNVTTEDCSFSDFINKEMCIDMENIHFGMECLQQWQKEYFDIQSREQLMNILKVCNVLFKKH